MFLGTVLKKFDHIGRAIFIRQNDSEFLLRTIFFSKIRTFLRVLWEKSVPPSNPIYKSNPIQCGMTFSCFFCCWISLRKTSRWTTITCNKYVSRFARNASSLQDPWLIVIVWKKNSLFDSIFSEKRVAWGANTGLRRLEFRCHARGRRCNARRAKFELGHIRVPFVDLKSKNNAVIHDSKMQLPQSSGN